MPISYSCTFYTNPRIMEAEQKILDWFDKNRHSPVTMVFLMELTGENQKTVEKALTQIRRYPGYRVDNRKKNKVYTYQVVYNQKKDPWRFLFNAG